MDASPPPPKPAESPRRQLTLFDSTAIILGIIIGATIYESTPLVAQNVPGPLWLALLWIAGGGLALLGALCYAELASSFPRSGGEYVFLSHAFGRTVGFLFAWVEYWVVRPGNLGAMAYVFAYYAHAILPLPLGPLAGYEFLVWAAAAILFLTAVHLTGVTPGKWTQNTLTTAKVLGLLLVFVVGLIVVAQRAIVPDAAATADPSVAVAGGGSETGSGETGSSETALGAAQDMQDSTDSPTPQESPEIAAAEETPPARPRFNYSLALLFVLFAYGGANEISCVASEVKNPRKNFFRAMVLGVVGVAVIYLLVNIAFVAALGFEGLRRSDAAASDVVRQVFGPLGGVVISLVICLSCLGAIHAILFTGARIPYAVGRHHRLFAWLGRWSRWDTPMRALLAQAAVALLLVALLGPDRKSFERLVVFTGPFFYGFSVLVAAAVFVLRWRYPQVERPYRVPFLAPVIFAVMCLFLGYMTFDYALYYARESGLFRFMATAVAVLLLTGLGVRAIERLVLRLEDAPLTADEE